MSVSTWSKRLTLTAATVLTTAGVALAAETPATKPAAPPPMSAEEKAMMESLTKSMTPGEHHKAMASWAGNWKTTVSMWMAPGAPPEVSNGTAEIKLTMDGRYMVEDMKGSSMGMPYMGHGVQGFDNVIGKHVGTWHDNFGTGIMTTVGTCDAGHKNITFTVTGSSADPKSYGTKTWRAVAHEDSPNKHTFTMHDKGPDGKEFKMMEIVYDRVM